MHTRFQKFYRFIRNEDGMTTVEDAGAMLLFAALAFIAVLCLMIRMAHTSNQNPLPRNLYSAPASIARESDIEWQYNGPPFAEPYLDKDWEPVSPSSLLSAPEPKRQ